MQLRTGIRTPFLLAIFYVSLAIFLLGCGTGSATEQPATDRSSGEEVIEAVATTGMVADMVQSIGGEHIQVTGLMGPGVDPHLFQATQGDVALLSEADIIFYNGLGLEGKIESILERMARQKPTVAIAESVDESALHASQTYQGQPDPHIWFDVSLWAQTIDTVRDALIELDPEHKDAFEANADAYREQLQELHDWVQEEMSKIPDGQRVLVTAHDAFGYFGTAYDIEVVGLQGISTSAEYGLQDVQRLVDLVVERGIRAVFVESSISERSIQAVVEGARARGHELVIGGTLYSDALGEAGTPEGTYIGMVRHNVREIVDALSR